MNKVVKHHLYDTSAEAFEAAMSYFRGAADGGVRDLLLTYSINDVIKDEPGYNCDMILMVAEGSRVTLHGFYYREMD